MICCFTASFSQVTKLPLIGTHYFMTIRSSFLTVPAPFNFNRHSWNAALQLNIASTNSLIQKIDLSEKKTYFFKNTFTDSYNSYIFYGNELIRDRDYMSWQDITPNCITNYRPLEPANAGILAGALLSVLVDNMDLKFRLFRTTTVTFE